MTLPPEPPRQGTEFSWAELRRRWPLSRAKTRLAAVLAGVSALAIGGFAAIGAAVSDGSGDLSGPRMQIALFDPPPPPPIEPGPVLDVLENAPNGFQGLPEPPPRVEPVGLAIDLPLDSPDPTLMADPLADARDGPEPRPARAARVYRSQGQDCSHARSRAEAMVCRDPQLSAADRRLRASLDRALDAGVADPRLILRDQSDWERALERASVDGPGALDRLYRLRQDELETAY